MASARPSAKELFLDALDVERDRRAAFVEDACGGDASLLAEVRGLLEAHDAADDDLVRTPISESMVASVVDLGPGDSVGPYRLVEVLGEGGFGIVFRAEQSEPVRRQVALKIVKLGMDTKAVVARFDAERQALAMMEHPNIARVLDGGATETGRPFFVMELVEGVPVTEYCAKAGMEVDERLELFRTVCLAVQHAHQKGVIHRDIKPTNVLVAEVDGRPVPKVIDFGIAKATGEQLTERSYVSVDGHLIGTPAYMSPEQAEGALDLDTRTDVYSLGVLLYELLAGTPPFDLHELGFPELQRCIREVDPPRPSAQRRRLLLEGSGAATGSARIEIAADLDWIVMRSLEKERTRRYPTANAFALDVERFLDDLPVEAAPPGPIYRAKKLFRRHRAATLAAAVVLVSLVLGVVGTGLGLVEARRANRDLDVALELARQETQRALAAEAHASEEAERARVAEARAAEEAEEARRQAAIAEEINRFLNDDLLFAVAPSDEYGRGRDVSMLEVLDLASQSIESAAAQGGRFAEAPAVEAAIRETIGNTYLALGEYERAARHLERGRDLHAELSGPESEDCLRLASLFAGALRRKGDAAASEAVLAETLPIQERLLGRTNPETLYSVARLARVWNDQERYEEAIAFVDGYLQDAETAHGEEEEAVVWILGELARATARLGDNERAGDLFARILAIHRRTTGDESIDTAGSLYNLGKVLSAQYRRADAEPYFAEAYGIQKRILGESHPGTLSTMQALGYTWFSLGRIHEAVELLGRAVDGFLATLGEDSVQTSLARLDYARVLDSAGDANVAIEHMRAAHDQLAGTLERWDSRVIRSAKDLALASLKRGNLADARQLLESNFAFEREQYEPWHDDLQQSRFLLGQLALQSGDVAGAERMLAEGVEASLQDSAEDRSWAGRFASKLANIANRTERYDEAERHARGSVRWLEETLPPYALEVVYARKELGSSLHGLGRSEEAEALLLECHRIASERYPAVGLDRMVGVELARLYRETGREEQASRYE